MFVIGMDLDSRTYFGSITVLIGLPTCIKVFNWLFTIFFYDFWFVLLFEFCMCVLFIFMFLFGGITGLLLANVGIDVLLHDTYFVVAHFHYVLSLGAVVGVFGCILHFCLRLFVCEYFMFVLLFCVLLLMFGSNCVFLQFNMLGLLSFPRSITD